MVAYRITAWFRRTFGRPRCVVILSAPRSGASFVASALQQAGLDLQGSKAATDASGSVENPPVVALNDAVLTESGGSWDQPPRQVEWSGAQLAQAREMVTAFTGSRVWGIKDPRLLLTLEGWRELLPDVQHVGVFRHPQAVAKSLQANCGIADQEQALSLWRDYNLRLLAMYRQAPFPILCFDPLLENPDARASMLARKLGLPKPKRVACYEAGLLRQRPDRDCQLPPDVQSLYASLQTVALI